MSLREENKRRTRAALLDAARAVIREKGFGGTTARDVAAAAGVAVGTVFMHFPTMAQLAETVLDEVVGQALAAAGVAPPAGAAHVAGAPPAGAAHVAGAPPAGAAHVAGADRRDGDVVPGLGVVDRLLAVCALLYDAYDTDPELSREVLAGSLFHHVPGGPADVRLRAFEVWVTDQIQAGRSAGELGDIDPREAFLGFFSLYFGVLVAGLRGQLDRPTQLYLLRSSLSRLLGSSERTM